MDQESAGQSGAPSSLRNSLSRETPDPRLKERSAVEALKSVQPDLRGVIFLFREETSGSVRFLFVSEDIRNITGDEAADITGGRTNLFDRILGEDLPGVLARITESRRYMTPWQHEFRLQSQAGQIRWVLANCTPYRGDGGAVLWQGMMADITNLKNATHALAPAEHRLDLAVDDIHAVVWKLDTSSGRLAVSAQWERIFGFAPGHRPKTFDELLELVHPGDVAAVRGALRLGGISRGSQQAVEFRLKTGHGDHLWVASRFEASGENGCIHGVLVDVTERKRVELDLFEAKKAADKYAGRISAELRAATGALERAERRLGLALKGAKGMVADIDRAAGRVEFSDHWNSMPGLSCLPCPHTLDELLEIFHSEDAEKFREMLRVIESDDVARTQEFRLKAGEEGILWVSIHLEAIHDERGASRGHVHCVFLDATDRKRMEQEVGDLKMAASQYAGQISNDLASTVESLQRELQETKEAAGRHAAQVGSELNAASQALQLSEQRLDLVLGGTRTACWRLHPSTGRLEVFGQWQSLPSLKALPCPQTLDDLISLVHPEDAENVRAAFALCDGSRERRCVEFRLRGGESPPAWLAAWLEPAPGDSGEPGDIHGIFMDITERKQAGRELTQALGQAQSAAKVKKDFLGIMSHEIRTPLNGVLGSAELLSNTRLSGEQAEHLRTIKDCSATLLAFLNDILSYSEIGDKHLVLNVEACDLRVALLSAIDIYRSEIEQKGLRLTITGFDTLPPRAVCDAPRLRQILQCLVSNAVKFTEKGEIRVTAGCLHEDSALCHVEINVLDTGIGIPEQDLARVFEPFYQSDSSTSRNHGGAGLGLAIVKRLVDAMNGEIKAESRPGKGSCFRIHFECEVLEPEKIAPAPPAVIAEEPVPVAESVPSPKPAAPEEPVRPAAEIRREVAPPRSEPVRSDRRALIVEDNAINRKLFRVMLERFGVVPEEAVNGLQGFEKAAATPYDIIFMDVQMPEMDGCEATRAIRDLPGGKSTRIVALTAFAGPEARERCFEAGMDYFLSKPVKLEDLQVVLDKPAA